MKLRNVISFHKKLEKKLGSDLVYSLALDEGKVLLVVSTHKSKTQRYKDKKHKKMQSMEIQGRDFDEDINTLVDRIARVYKQILENYDPTTDNGEDKENT